MNTDSVVRTIQLILAPVVMLTSCSLIINGLLQRYGAVNDRMRAMAHERLDLLRSTGGTLSDAVARADPFTRERLKEIDRQLPALQRRHRLLHDAALVVYVSIIVFVASMFIIAVAALSRATWAATAALLVFLIGTAVLLLGVLIVVVEVRRSQREIHYEVLRVMALGKGEE